MGLREGKGGKPRAPEPDASDRRLAIETLLEQGLDLVEILSSAKAEESGA